MKPNLTRLHLAAVAAAILGWQAMFAQTAPAPSAGTNDDNAVKLDPFNVSATSDVGFVAANSLAGGRMTTALKDFLSCAGVTTSC